MVLCVVVDSERALTFLSESLKQKSSLAFIRKDTLNELNIRRTRTGSEIGSLEL